MGQRVVSVQGCLAQSAFALQPSRRYSLAHPSEAPGCSRTDADAAPPVHPGSPAITPPLRPPTHPPT